MLAPLHRRVHRARVALWSWPGGGGLPPRSTYNHARHQPASSSHMCTCAHVVTQQTLNIEVAVSPSNMAPSGPFKFELLAMGLDYQFHASCIGWTFVSVRQTRKVIFRRETVSRGVRVAWPFHPYWACLPCAMMIAFPGCQGTLVRSMPSRL